MIANSRYPHAPVLVIDDEEAILLSIDTTLQLAGINNVLTCSDSRQATGIVERCHPGVVLLDLNMPHIDGEAILERINSHFPDIPVIIITGRIDAETAVDCMKSGAFDYVVKPVDETRLLASVKKALEFRKFSQAGAGQSDSGQEVTLRHPEHFSHIVTNSPKMMQLFTYAESIATTSQPVLIRGETGTGKELIACAIHQCSGLDGEFVAINVAGLDDNVFSDTLFGHIKGAFTGADKDRPGLIEQAAGGTLFLDEIGDLSTSSQIKLLRLLQEHEYMPLGEDRNRKSKARIIASTHVDLWKLQQQEQFRQDLHYRLRTHRITLPPLRERKEDIPILIDHFLGWAADALNKAKSRVPIELINLLSAYHFPGNVRELQAMIFDAVAQGTSPTLSLGTFREHIARTRRAESKHLTGSEQYGIPITFSDPLPTIKEATRLLVEEAMHRAGNNQSAAAAMLGISQQALSKRLQKIDRQS